MFDMHLLKIVDEIDHLTIIYTKGGELDKQKAVAMIRRYSSYFDEAAAIDDPLISDLSAQKNASQAELYKCLVAIRTVLLKKAGVS